MREILLFLLTWSVGSACSVYENVPVAVTGTDGGVEMPKPALETVLYVAAENGDDTRAGLSPSTAVRTIVHAVRLAAERKITEIRVCRGTYVERNLLVSNAIHLRGGYDCRTWERNADTFGSAHGFTDINETVLVPDPSQTERATLNVSGISANDVVVDGFTVHGVDASAAGIGVAARVADKARLKIQDCNVLGGEGMLDTAVTGPASIGLWATDGTLEVSASRVLGGSGVVSAGTGSAAILATESELTVRGTTLRSGKGRGEYCGVGLNAINSKTTLMDSSIEVEPCVADVVLPAPGAFGIRVQRGSIEASNNQVGVNGVTCSNPSTLCVTYGIAIGTATGALFRNWVWGVPPRTPLAERERNFRGIQLNQTVDFKANDNVVHIEGDATSTSIGMFAVNVKGLTMANNLVLGNLSAPTPSTQGISIATSTGVTAANNLVNLQGTAVGMSAQRCEVKSRYQPTAGDIVLRNNAVYGSTPIMRASFFSGSPCIEQSFASFRDPGIVLALGSSAESNVDLSTSMVMPENPSLWLPAVKNKTLQLTTTNAACDIAKKGIDVGGTGIDIAGNARDPKAPTIGPWEARVVCN